MKPQKLFSYLPDSFRYWLRTLRAVNEQNQNSAREMCIEKALDSLAESDRRIIPDDKERPIFLLATSWRSGSTLLQRLLCSDQNVLIWGEPFDRMCIVQTMTAMLRAFDESYPKRHHSLNRFGPHDQLKNEWIANLSPQVSDLRMAFRQYFITLFGIPAAQSGFVRWGLKEVRLNGEHVRFMNWLFPQSRFLLLARDPLQAWNSYREVRSFYDHWPDSQVRNPEHFARLWERKAVEFTDLACMENVLLVKMEDLVANPKLADAIGTFAGLNLDASLLNIRMRGTFPERSEAPSKERELILSLTENGRHRLDYDRPDG